MEDLQTIEYLKKNLHKSIESTRNIDFLKSIFYLIEAHKQIEQKFFNEIPDSHKKILDERLEEYERNPETSLEWDIVKKEIEKIL